MGLLLSALNWEVPSTPSVKPAQTPLKEQETGYFLIDDAFIKVLYLVSCYRA